MNAKFSVCRGHLRRHDVSTGTNPVLTYMDISFNTKYGC